jgi:hypothetical protein
MERTLTRAENVAAFQEGEGTLLLEGLVPTSFYMSLKDRVIKGEITTEQAKRDVLAHYTVKA